MLCKQCLINEVPEYNLKKHDYHCTKCNYQRHKEAKTRADQKARDKRKQQVFEHYGTECVFCHSTDDLHIDHMSGNGSGESGTEFYRRLIKEGFPEGYQTLCRQCNMAKQQMSNAEFKSWIVKLYNALQGV